MIESKMKENSNIIILRVISYLKNDNYYAICLDTDIMVHGNSSLEVKSKMIDAIKVYMRSFSKEEIKQGKYIRKAPLRYFLKLRYFVLSFAFHQFKGSINSAEYDPLNHNLQLA